MMENGKLADETAREANHVDRGVRFAAALAAQPFGRVLDPGPGQQAMVIRQPAGVAGIIVPWNSPVVLCLRAVQAALAAGCTMVVKLPGNAAQIAGELSRAFASVAEIPPGVINVVVESGSAGAELLVSSPQVPVISFTGSTRTGRLISQSAAAHFKHVALELGGKNPHLVFGDVDLDAAIPVIARSSTMFAGQFCMAGSRILVHRAIAGEFTGRLAERLRAVRPGLAADPSSQIGPLIDKANVARVDAAVREAIDKGARAIVRGGPSTVPELVDGAFYHPTLLAVEDTSLDIVQEETFGPVMEFEEGGWKASGVGRLHGLSSIDDFLEYKQIGQNFS